MLNSKTTKPVCAALDKRHACPTPGLKNSGRNSSMSGAGKSQSQADHKARVEIATPTQTKCYVQYNQHNMISIIWPLQGHDEMWLNIFFP
jgi:hypothetical protein